MTLKDIDLDRCRAVYAALRREGSPLSVEAGKCLSLAMAQRKPKAKEKVKNPIHPLHMEIINFRPWRPRKVEFRDQGEFNAWGKAFPAITPAKVKTLKWFYELPETKNDESTCCRKKTVTALLNQINAQYDLAYAHETKHRKSYEPKELVTLPEPRDWKSRVVGKLPSYTWDFICKSWPEEAKDLQDPTWEMEDHASKGLANFAPALEMLKEL